MAIPILFFTKNYTNLLEKSTVLLKIWLFPKPNFACAFSNLSVRPLRIFRPLFNHETPECLSFVTLASIDPSVIFLNSQIIFKT
jgi:hypothetical protein